MNNVVFLKYISIEARIILRLDSNQLIPVFSLSTSSLRNALRENIMCALWELPFLA